MDQAELELNNRALMKTFLCRLGPGEIIGAIVTVRTDAKGLVWHPMVASSSGELLEMLRKKPDEVHIKIERKS